MLDHVLDSVSDPQDNYIDYKKHYVVSSNNPKAKPVVGKNYSTGEIKEFNSIAHACRYTSLDKKTIKEQLDKKNKQLVKNWFFLYPSKELNWPII